MMRDALKRLSKPRFLLVYPLAVWLFVAAVTSERSFRIGIVLVSLGETLRLWANGYVGHVKVNRTQQARGDTKIGRLITAGPYAFVRHPLYLGTFLIGLGFCLTVENIWVSLVALLFFLVVYGAKMRKEERLLLDECGVAYARYLAAVPRWLPFGKRYADRQGQWSWQGIAASKELKTVVWIMVTFLALYLREELWQEREPFSFKHALVTAVIAMLILWDVVGELRKRLRRQSLQTSPSS